jgi:hypothetical protein
VDAVFPGRVSPWPFHNVDFRIRASMPKMMLSARPALSYFNLRQRLAVIPGHPFGRIGRHLPGVAL